MASFVTTTTDELRFFGAFNLPPQALLLVLLLFAATVVDLRERRIPNCLVATGIAAAFAFHILAPQQGEGIVFALSGLAVGMATLLPMYLLRLMGAGDVKLMGMIGAFLGMSGAVGAVLASMAAGAALALATAAGKRMLPQLFANLRGIVVQCHISQMTHDLSGIVRPAASVGNMPYAVAITAGTLVQLFFLRY